MGIVRNFEQGAQWSNKEGGLTERAHGMLRSLFDFTGATFGAIPITSINQGMAPTWTAPHTFNNGITTTTLVSTDAATIGGAFGCNGQTAQTSATVAVAISDTAGGAYTATEQGMLNDLKALTNQLRAALVSNGIAV
jgi:hypothetical protein